MIVLYLNDFMLIGTALLIAFFGKEETRALNRIEGKEDGGFNPAHTVVSGLHHTYC